MKLKYFYKFFFSAALNSFLHVTIQNYQTYKRARRGGYKGCGRLGRSPAPNPTKLTFFTMVLYNSENKIRHMRPMCRPLFYHSSVVKYTSSPYSSEPVMRLDYQILLKLPLLTREVHYGGSGIFPNLYFESYSGITC